MPIDEFEFRRILNCFPVVRSRDYRLDSESSSPSTSSSKVNEDQKERQDGMNSVDKKYSDSHRSDFHDAFWEKLKSVAEKKMGPYKAQKFCQAFQKVYRRLVYEELSLEAARRFLNSSVNSHC